MTGLQQKGSAPSYIEEQSCMVLSGIHTSGIHTSGIPMLPSSCHLSSYYWTTIAPTARHSLHGPVERRKSPK
jgi:hypothetical protein